MTITPTTLTRLAAVAAVSAGIIFIGVQIGHPHADVTSVTTTEWAVRNSLKVLMAALALGGITGMYLRQVKETGVLGLVGYLLFSVGYLAMLCVETIALVVVPTIVGSSPEYVEGVVAVATNSSSSADLGLFRPLNLVIAAGYLLGGLIFGIALFRAGVLARWAAALLAVAAVLTMTIPLLPMVNQRLFAVVNGVAMVGLGWSLWREQRSAANLPVTSSSGSRLDPAGAR